jgi:hypothetical protein
MPSEQSSEQLQLFKQDVRYARSVGVSPKSNDCVIFFVLLLPSIAASETMKCGCSADCNCNKGQCDCVSSRISEKGFGQKTGQQQQQGGETMGMRQGMGMGMGMGMGGQQMEGKHGK